jgi:hypothetical protein
MAKLNPKIEMLDDVKQRGTILGRKYMPTVDEWYENIDGQFGVYSSKHIIVG